MRVIQASTGVGDDPQRAEQMLEQVPAAEIIDDQLVFGERAVLEGRLWFGLPQPAVGDETAGHRAIAKEMDIVLAAELDKAIFRARIDQRILHLHAGKRKARGDEFARMRGVEIRAPEQVDLADLVQLLEPERSGWPMRSRLGSS